MAGGRYDDPFHREDMVTTSDDDKQVAATDVGFTRHSVDEMIQNINRLMDRNQGGKSRYNDPSAPHEWREL